MVQVNSLSIWEYATIPSRLKNLRKTRHAAVNSFMRVKHELYKNPLQSPVEDDWVRLENLYHEMVKYDWLLFAIKFAGMDI